MKVPFVKYVMVESVEDLIEAVTGLPKVCEHVHLPLQSGSERVLKAMHRTYTPEKYRKILQRLRERIPGVAVSTDLIVGFSLLGATDIP